MLRHSFRIRPVQKQRKRISHGDVGTWQMSLQAKPNVSLPAANTRGCIAGTVILLLSKGKSSHILRFSEELFFIYLLPPIIFNAGFQMKKKQFFQNFITIMLFGVIGVFISASIIAAGSWWLFPKLGFVGLSARDYLAVGTIFSSTDTVCTLQVLHQDETPLLYSLVFGEGVVNDATSVVLFNAIQKIDVSRITSKTPLRLIVDFIYLFTTSTALGVSFGLVTAYSLKTLYFGRHSTVRELAIMVLMAYLSYMLAEFTHSGVTWDPVNAAMITNTIIVVLFTTLVFGFLTKPLIHFLLPHRVVDEKTESSSVGSKSPKEDMTLPLLSFQESASTNILRAKDSLSMLIERPVYTVHFYWRKFDDSYMRPIFGGPLSSSPEC
ncbi:Na+/H+ exchanger [Corchorus olitorius]|uniref:Na+/H+ exchanger n=1 Tax=Corchorus olitorius TaxID=93759 RepID=A0A1R3KB25_9ROSI|nr:Na+/H+ exchanger [Corchorus olitorius]